MSSNDQTIRVLNLSDKPPEVAEMLYREFKDFVSYPFLMPDGSLRYPTGHRPI